MALSYDPTKLPYPATNDQQFLNAILVELRAIRIALEKQNTVSMPYVQTTTTLSEPKPTITVSTPAVTKVTRK